MALDRAQAANSKVRDPSEDLLCSALDSMLEGCQIIDREWRYAYLNRAAEVQARRPREELLGRVFHEAWPGVENTELFRRMKRCMDERIAERMDNIFSFPDGSTGVFELSIEPVPAGILILSVDITERRESEKALRLAHEGLTGTMSALPDLLFRVDREGRILEYHSPGEGELYVPPGEFIGKSFADLLPDDAARVISQTIESASEQGSFCGAAYCLPMPQGQRWYEPSVRTTGGDTGDFIVLVRDVTQRVELEEELRASEERYRFMAENMADVIWLMDPATALMRYMSPSIERLLGYTAEELLALPPDRYFSPDSAELVGPIIGAMVQAKGGSPLAVRMDFIHRDGRTVPVELSMRYLPGDERHPPSIIGVTHDVSERVEAERRLVRKEEELREAQKLEAIGLLAGGVAHQYNNMLASILGYADFLLSDPSLGGSDAQRFLQVIKNEGERAADLTRELLTLSQKQYIHPSVVFVNEAVLDVVPSVNAVLGEAVQLRLTLEHTAGRVAVDVHQLGELVEILAGNARDAMSAGGTLTIGTSNVELQERAANALQVAPGAYVLLRVEDTGTGMDRETMAHLFEPFFTTKGQGKGLGLPVARGIVRQSRGAISVSSEMGRGTTVDVYLPRMAKSAG